MKKSLRAILVMGILSTFVALAADQPAATGDAPAGGQGGRMRGGGPGGGGPGGFGGPGGRGSFQTRGGVGMMGLNDEQRQVFQEVVQKESEKLRALDEKLRTAQKELVEATLASTYDDKAVQAKAEAVAKIQVEITMIRAVALATVAPTLKPEQKQQLVESRAAIMLLGAGGMGGMVGMGGGPGGMPGGGFRQGRQGGPGGGFPGGGPGGPPNARPAVDR